LPPRICPDCKWDGDDFSWACGPCFDKEYTFLDKLEPLDKPEKKKYNFDKEKWVKLVKNGIYKVYPNCDPFKDNTIFFNSEKERMFSKLYKERNAQIKKLDDSPDWHYVCDGVHPEHESEYILDMRCGLSHIYSEWNKEKEFFENLKNEFLNYQKEKKND